MSLPTDWVVGDTGHAAAHDNLATQVNTNTAAIASNAAAIALKQDAATAVTVKTAGVTSRLWIQGSDPDTTNPGEAADGDLWFYPA